MASPSNSVPCFHISTSFVQDTFVHRPGIAKETNTAQKYENSFPYQSNVYARVNLANGRFRTDDPERT